METFHWGVSAAAAQTEGACFDDGKGASIWDKFAEKRNKIRNSATLHPGTDFYRRYREDISLIAEMKIPNFRFSLSWPRILPSGTGVINQKGIDFYNRVIDCCLEYKITPWITLYHWDLPQALEEKGGWLNRDVIGWFDEYSAICAKAFGDRVKNWIVLNEPMAFCGAGYLLGVHAPGKRGINNFVKAAHHATLCTSVGAGILRQNIPDAFVGSTYSMSHIAPYTESAKDIEAAMRADDLLNNFFLYASLGKGYPLKRLPFLQKIEKCMHDGDDKRMKADLDFIGVQNYTREVVKHSWITPFIKAKVVRARKRNVAFTDMGWEVYPEGIYHVLKKTASIPGCPPLVITENGAAFPDTIEHDGNVNDIKRINFLTDYITQVMRAKNEGVDVRGYFVWSLTDNFEWAEGYTPRFGLIHIDYENNLKRTVKESGKWYGEKIRR